MNSGKKMGVRILAFAGSTRGGSFNKKLIKIAAAGASAAGAEVTLIDLRDYSMPLYDGDLEASEGLPDNAHLLRRLFFTHDGLLVACPEYNSSISGVLKNTIDWVSRPRPDEPDLACFTGKVAAIMSASPGNLGGLRGLVTVRSILSNIGVLVLPGQIATPKAAEAFDADGSLKDKARHAQVEALGRRLVEMLMKLKA
jgi:chromate reductase, NAD(P)H dehydrogenase (quinone)